MQETTGKYHRDSAHIYNTANNNNVQNPNKLSSETAAYAMQSRIIDRRNN